MVELKVGVIAFQGDVSEHARALERSMDGKGLVVLIRRAGIVPECDGLVIPGGESTTISKQLESSGVRDEIKRAASSGLPILATCAGLVLMAREIEDDSSLEPMGLMDIKIDRNAFGPQRDSFEATLQVQGFDRPYRAVFIRAPAIINVGEGVQELARLDDMVVAARQKNVIGLAFHPELTEDMRFHKIFIEMIRRHDNVL